MQVTEEQAAEMADEVIAIIKAGYYELPAGGRVPIRELLVNARAGTISYPPGHDRPTPQPRDRQTRVEVVNATTLDAARALVEQGKHPAALNFANARVPGGGFVAGARAQEESLCWSSGLFACLLGNHMYGFHEKQPGFLYTDYVIYSQDVPVFRGEDGILLAEPWLCSFLTSPAPFASLHTADEPKRVRDLGPAFQTRIAKVLRVAAFHQHEALVLGAWGCGAFGNDATMVSRLFREALEGPFQGVFSDVVFAITDHKKDRRCLGPFESTFQNRANRMQP